MSRRRGVKHPYEAAGGDPAAISDIACGWPAEDRDFGAQRAAIALTQLRPGEVKVMGLEQLPAQALLETLDPETRGDLLRRRDGLFALRALVEAMLADGPADREFVERVLAHRETILAWRDAGAPRGPDPSAAFFDPVGFAIGEFLEFTPPEKWSKAALLRHDPALRGCGWLEVKRKLERAGFVTDPDTGKIARR